MALPLKGTQIGAGGEFYIVIIGFMVRRFVGVDVEVCFELTQSLKALAEGQCEDVNRTFIFSGPVERRHAYVLVFQDHFFTFLSALIRT